MYNLNVLPAPTKNITVLTYNDYYMRLTQLANSMFKWNNLPNDIPERFIEKLLFNWGHCGFINDKDMGFMVTRITPSGELNCYDDPVHITAYAVNYEKRYKTDDIVIIRNNPFEVPTSWSIRLFAQRLTEVERTLDVNIKAQKTPIIILTDEKQRLTMRNFMLKYDGNTPFIFGNKGLDLESVKALNTEAPYLADQLMIYKHDVWNEAMSFLGIQNANTDKKERLITDEVTANNQLVMLSANIMLAARERACNEINEKFGTDISVELRSEQDVFAAMGVQNEGNEESVTFASRAGELTGSIEVVQ